MKAKDTEIDKFRAFASKLIAVPKKEIDEQRKKKRAKKKT